MKKKKTIFFCEACGYESVQWLGKCPQCATWNSFTEFARPAHHDSKKARTVRTSKKEIQPLTAISGECEDRIAVGIGEFDRVLGGGLVSHTSVLFAGEPGIGKSTLLLQVCACCIRQYKKPIVYVTAEESIRQVRARALRLGINEDALYVVRESDCDEIVQTIEKLNPQLVVIDSIQTVYENAIPSAPGTVTQVREVAFRLNNFAKEKGFILCLIGHVTKDGVLAGPRTLEHMVDVVVYFEGDRYESLRLVRTIKNRYGETGEIGVFEMGKEGLTEVTNPSSIFLSEGETVSPGRAIVPVLEGRRPFLVEIQALTNKTSFNNPLRRTVGMDLNKLSLLIAVIERSVGIALHGYDIFMKAVGGLYLSEPACDLGCALAILSSFFDVPISSDIVAIGEIGLSGEVRRVSMLEMRIREAERLGFKRILVPPHARNERFAPQSEIQEVRSLKEAYGILFKGVIEKRTV